MKTKTSLAGARASRSTYSTPELWVPRFAVEQIDGTSYMSNVGVAFLYRMVYRYDRIESKLQRNKTTEYPHFVIIPFV